MRRYEKGAAIVEFAIIVPLILTLIVAIMDFGEAWVKSSSVQSSVRSASIVGFDLGTSYRHDYDVLRAVLLELESQGIQGIESITIFNADNNSKVIPGCETTNNFSGIPGECNVYGRDFFPSVIDGTALKQFIPGNCGASPHAAWCPETRNSSGEKWTVGVQVRINEKSLTGFFPFFDEYTIQRAAFIEEFKRDYN